MLSIISALTAGGCVTTLACTAPPSLAGGCGATTSCKPCGNNLPPKPAACTAAAVDATVPKPVAMAGAAAAAAEAPAPNSPPMPDIIPLMKALSSGVTVVRI